MSNKKSTQKHLGKGLGALFGDSISPAATLSYANETIREVPIGDIIPNPDQPRKHFNNDSLEELAVSVKEFGILQPLVVTQSEHNKYSLVAGERRWRAAQIAKLKSVPVVVRTMSELETLEIALIENVQREDLTPLDQAVSIERLHEQFSLSYEQIASKLGKAYSTVSNIVRLLQLPAHMQQALKDGVISEGHARALLSLQKDTLHQDELFLLIQEQHLSVRQAEQYVVGLKSRTNTSEKKHIERTKSDTKETKELTRHFGIPVSVHYLARGGKISLRFTNEEQYRELIKRLLAS